MVSLCGVMQGAAFSQVCWPVSRTADPQARRALPCLTCCFSNLSTSAVPRRSHRVFLLISTQYISATTLSLYFPRQLQRDMFLSYNNIQQNIKLSFWWSDAVCLTYAVGETVSSCTAMVLALSTRNNQYNNFCDALCCNNHITQHQTKVFDMEK